MTLLLRDSIDAPLIPRDTPVVAGYGDGAYIWSPAWKASGGFPAGVNWWDLFPAAVKLVIVVDAAHAGDVLDVESGAASPADVPGWCDRFNRPARRAPSIYCNRSTWPLVQQAVGGRQVDYWIATLDGTTAIPGAVAVQYIDLGAYDESVIHDPSWVGLENFPMLDATDPIVQELRAHMRYVQAALFSGQRIGVGFDASGAPYEVPEPSWQFDLRDRLDAIKAAIGAAGTGLTPAQVQLLQDAHDAIARLEAALKGA